MKNVWDNKLIVMVILLFFLLLTLSVGGNNVKVSGAPELVLGSDGSSVELTFQLSWENSWRDEFNWDAAWVFVKYKREGAAVAWSHLNLGNNQAAPSGFTIDCAKTGAKNVGAFIFRDRKNGGNVSMDMTLKTTLAELSGVTVDDLRTKKICVAISAIEMVYVPYGAYYLGDGASNNTFKSLGADGTVGSYLVDSEKDIPLGSAVGQLNATGGGSWMGSLPATYPKGYRGFYCMKYELSQEQYVSFLNMLSYTQQNVRIGNTLDGLKKGDYIFGDRNSPSARNGIAVFAQQAGKSALFANNLTKDDQYYAANDGQNVACNYLTPEDMLAYCDWAGLRPMSEIEYEKTCRRPYPQPVVAKEYAWNKTVFSKISGAGDMTDLNRETETAAGAEQNVNVGNPAFGPVRCGSFGFASSTQTQSGGTFWGAMEMSGNVGEICYSAIPGNNAFNASDPMLTHGDGAINASGLADVSTGYWPVGSTAANFVLRGGSFASADTNLRVSDRTVLSVTTVRDSSRGFRAVRTFGGGSVTLDAGSIIAENGLAADTACPGTLFTIKSNADANLIGMSDIPVSYIWYMDDKVIPNESGAELRYNFENSTNTLKSIVIKRKAVCAVGEKEVGSSIIVKIPNTEFNLSKEYLLINTCGLSESTVATTLMNGANVNYTWFYLGEKIMTGATYKPSYSHFKDNYGELDVICEGKIMKCTKQRKIKVEIPFIQLVSNDAVTTENCGKVSFRDSRDGQIYCTVKIGELCWMGRNLNVGARINAGDLTAQSTPGIQKICFNNDENNCDQNGGLYSFYETIYGELVNTTKYVAGTNNLVIQGICPDGWHVASKKEWEALATNWSDTWDLQFGGIWLKTAGFINVGPSSYKGYWRADCVGDNLGDGSGTPNYMRVYGSTGGCPGYPAWGDYAYNIVKSSQDGISVRCVKN